MNSEIRNIDCPSWEFIFSQSRCRPAGSMVTWLNINEFDTEYALVSLEKIEKGELSSFAHKSILNAYQVPDMGHGDEWTRRQCPWPSHRS